MKDEIVPRRENKCPFMEPSPSSTTNGCPFSGSIDSLGRTPASTPIVLHNYQTKKPITASVPNSNLFQDCRHQVCTSTLMSLAPHAPRQNSVESNDNTELQSKSRDYVRKEAYDFLAIFRHDKKMSEKDYEKRLEQIDLEISNTGLYNLTFEELEYGCRLAWRNAARCINRLFWPTLKVIDRRHVNTNDTMFAEICDHLRMAYNKGTLQATTLVLGREARVWSMQYLRFACYERDDGSMLGDPGNRELTEVAMKLGWNKPEKQRTQWDLLPIIVQADPNIPPNWYELPEDLRQLAVVYLSHPEPKYDAAIKKLGLRWVIQPFVADKAIEIGGIVFTCVPFSGWFMETEIGRNLCDIQRYNFIPKLAASLDLDITAAANSQLNVDRIYVEINASVLYSFQKAKIAIVDHHTAAAGFMKFMEQEVEQRGNTPADWIWLVPPVSGGMSVIFHQEMLNYVVKPRVLDQRDPWTYYNGFRPVKEPTRPIISLPLTAATQEVAVHILYASATGTAHSYAQQMAKRLTIDGYQTTLMMLDNYPFREVTEKRALVIIITSTFGQGNAPEGGVQTEEWLKQEMAEVDENNNQSDTARPRSRNSNRQSYQSTKNSLEWCTYAVCAIGSSAYPVFCGFGKLIDQSFRCLGAHPLVPLGTCDALNQQYKSFNEWEENTVMTLKKKYPNANATTKVPALSSPVSRPTLMRSPSYIEERVSLTKSVQPSLISLQFFPKSDEILSSKSIGPFTRENPYNAVVLQNIELTGGDSATNHSTPEVPKRTEASATGSPTTSRRVTIPSHFTNVNNDEHRSVRLIKLRTPDLSFYPGDHVCILPENTLANVNAIIVACGWQLGNKLLSERCSLASLTNNQYFTLRQILTNFVDLVTTPRPHLLNTIATYATAPTQQRQLFELGKGGQRYADWLVNLPTIKEMLEQFSSIRIPLEELIQVSSINHRVFICPFYSVLDSPTPPTTLLFGLLIEPISSG